MSSEQLDRIKGYVKVIDNAASDASANALLEYCINEVYDRVLLYLNDTTLDEALERVVARIVSGIFNQTTNSKTSTESDQAISSVSDNGQSVSFSNEVKNYLATTEDNELFAGFSKLLARYRRINVVS
ncbi:MAG: hypothetical protein IKE94_07290 [Aeriscardovia sp.]|nr:hypothetical protein [Aeriscardovia sp.]